MFQQLRDCVISSTYRTEEGSSPPFVFSLILSLFFFLPHTSTKPDFGAGDVFWGVKSGTVKKLKAAHDRRSPRFGDVNIIVIFFCFCWGFFSKSCIC